MTSYFTLHILWSRLTSSFEKKTEIEYAKLHNSKNIDYPFEFTLNNLKPLFTSVL